MHALKMTAESDPLLLAQAFEAGVAARGAASDLSGDPTAEIEELRRSGLLGVELASSPRVGVVLLDLLRGVGRCSLPLGRLYEGHINALQLIATFGSPRQKLRARADAAKGLLFGVWNTESADGVRLLEEPLTLAGAKTFASGAGFVQRPLITARRSDGVASMVLVRLDDGAPDRVDLAGWDPLGMRASASGRLDFTGLAISRDDVIGAPGDYHRQPWFSAGAIRFSAVQLGGAEALAGLFRDHLIDRRRAEDPYQIARMADVAMGLETAKLWLRGAGSLVGSDEALVAYVNLARSAVERVCLDVMEAATRGIGVQALLRPHPFERILRDLTTYLRQPAPDSAIAAAGRFVLGSPGKPHTLWS